MNFERSLGLPISGLVAMLTPEHRFKAVEIFLERAGHSVCTQVPATEPASRAFRDKNAVMAAFEDGLWPTLNAMADAIGLPICFGVEKQEMVGAQTCKAVDRLSCPMLCILQFSQYVTGPLFCIVCSGYHGHCDPHAAVRACYLYGGHTC